MKNQFLTKIQEGEGAKFNSSLASLERMHTEMIKANNYSGEWTVNSFRKWFSALKSLERELYPYMNKEEKKELEEYDKVPIPPNNDKLLGSYYQKLDSYDKFLRLVHAAHGFGLVNDSLDPGNALEEDDF